jgi:aminoglycoside phosphotransferase (APT) family kinase protein
MPMFADRYEVIDRLARGGQASVYLANDRRTGDLVAIKVIDSDANLRQGVRFALEAEVMLALTHPNVVRVLHAGDEDGVAYIVMELCRGSLADRLEEHQALPFEEARQWTLQLLDALDAAHAKSIVHRDIKPSNLLVGPDGLLRVTDFGVARIEDVPGMTHTGTGLGTYGYMAPEQRRAASRATYAADLYAAGATFYALSTGREPDELWSTETRQAAFEGLPINVVAFLSKATAYEPAERFTSARDMANALADLDPTATHLAWRYRTIDPRVAFGAFVASGVGAGLVLGAALVTGIDVLAPVPAPPAPVEIVTAPLAAEPAPPAPVVEAPKPRARAAAPPPAPVPVATQPPVYAFINARGHGEAAALSIDGAPAGGSYFRGELAPGEHELVWTRPDAEPVRRTVTVDPGREFKYCLHRVTGEPCGE